MICQSRLACLVLTATIALFSRHAAAQGYLFNQYGAPPTNALTDNTLAFAQGDFNQDGRLDFAVAEYLSGGYPGVGIYLAQSDGTYQLNQVINLDAEVTSDNLYTIAVADINGDGLPDIVCVGGTSGNVYALLGEGNGLFQSAVVTATGIPGVNYIAVGDFNGDGLADVALDTTYGGYAGIYVLLSNGDGTFGAANATGIGGQGVITGDWNGDGKLDLATTNPDAQSVYVQLGNGDGTFQSPITTAFSSDVYPSSLAGADMNGDGKLDLVVGLAYNSLAVLLGDGNGSFQTPIITGGLGFAWSGVVGIATGDFNGDGKLDVAADTYYGAWVLLGQGNGTFKSSPQGYGTTTITNGVGGVLAGDYNLDGKLDLAQLVDAGTLFPPFSILTNNGNGTFLSGVSLQNAKKTADTFGVVSADFNKDGIPDLVAINKSTNNLSVFLGKGKGEFLTPKIYATGNNPDSVAVGDFNRDGYEDLAVTNYNDGTVSVFLNKGNGTFQNQATYAVGARPFAIVTADVNNDGKLDLVVAGGSALLTVLLGNGNGTFQTMTSYGAGASTSVALADFNGDGNVDAVLAGGTCNIFSVAVMFGDGDGGFGAPQCVSIFPGDSVVSVAAGNIGGFGVQDIVVGFGGCTVQCIGVLLNNGDGTFQSPAFYYTSQYNSVYSLLLADVNGDGNLDIVASAEPYVAVLLGNGGGGFGEAQEWYGNTGTGPNGVAVADFNGDGSPDVAATNANGTNGVSLNLFLSNPVGVFSSSSLNFGPVKIKSSSTLTLTLTNQSSTKLSVSKIAITGSGFTQTNSCGTLVAAYANCTVNVTFKPTVKKAYSASLAFTDSTAGPKRTIPLVGTGD
jgi:hypothetical protein